MQCRVYYHNTLPGDLNTNYIIFRNAENFKTICISKNFFCEGKFRKLVNYLVDMC